MNLHLSDRSIHLNLALDGSKSISNRALIMLALSGSDADTHLSGLSTSKDTTTLLALLAAEKEGATTFDAGDAGTVFRFMAAYLSMRPGTQVLTGSQRMLQRPIGALANGLRALGVPITYLGEEGYPPLQIGHNPETGKGMRRIEVEAGVSSQFLSALLMIAPYLPEGLELVPAGRMVSRPYLDLTLRLMQYFGADCRWEAEHIVVEPGRYQPRAFRVEADWSAASYWYSVAALSEEAHIRLEGLFEDSAQGDAVLVKMMQHFGVHTRFEGDAAILSKAKGAAVRPLFEWDFLECPDIAQTLAVVCAGLGVQGLFSGLETLSIKETDRIAAIKAELAKIGVSFVKLPARFSAKHPDRTYYLCEGKAQWEAGNAPTFATYNDHRMAMAFAPLALLGPVQIEDPEVVKKSYVQFWAHFGQLK